MSVQDDLYRQAADEHGPALTRLARAYEADHDRRRDLLQEIHVALWRSFRLYDGRCSMRTWIYRVAHNTATSLVTRRRGKTPALVTLEEAAAASTSDDHETRLDRQRTLERLLALIRALKPIDKQLMLLHLEGMDAASIGDVTGLSAGNVATKLSRMRTLLAEKFKTATGERDDT